MKRYFITGTDTDCGKTWVTCRLLEFFQQSGHSALALKPVASGCEWEEGRLVSSDAAQLNQFNFRKDLNINPWAYEWPVSPHLAAAAVGERLSAKAIHDFCAEHQFSGAEHLLVEGAGGLLVPLNEEETWLDFLKISGMEVILVAGIRLGCINHALLTAEVLKTHGIPCFGWIANILDADMPFCEENIATLKAKMHIPLITTVANCGKIIELF